MTMQKVKLRYQTKKVSDIGYMVIDTDTDECLWDVSTGANTFLLEECDAIIQKQLEHDAMMSKQKIDVWLGNFEFGEFKKGDDLYPITIIHRLDDIVKLSEEEIEDVAWARGLEYLVPSEYKGEIVFTRGAQ